MMPSLLPPMSTMTASRFTATTIPVTIWPSPPISVAPVPWAACSNNAAKLSPERVSVGWVWVMGRFDASLAFARLVALVESAGWTAPVRLARRDASRSARVSSRQTRILRFGAGLSLTRAAARAAEREGQGFGWDPDVNHRS